MKKVYLLLATLSIAILFAYRQLVIVKEDVSSLPGYLFLFGFMFTTVLFFIAVIQLKKELKHKLHKSINVKINPNLALTALIVLSLGFTQKSFATNYFSRQSGNWGTTSTWSLTSGGGTAGSLPGAGDNVIIERGFTVTVNGNFSCASVQIASTATNNTGTLTFSGTNPSLTVSGAVLIGSSGNASRDGIITFTASATLTAGSVTLGGGAATPASGTITMTAGGTLITGSLAVNTATGNTWTPGAGTVQMNATNTLPSTIFTTFNNLVISAGTTTSSGVAFSATGSVTVNAGNLILSATNSDYTITGDLIVPVGGTLTHSVDWGVAGKLLRVNGNISVDGIFTYTVRSHVQMGGVNKTVRTGSNASSAFSIFTLVNTSGTITASGTININDNFWASFGIAGGTFQTSTFTVNAKGALLNSGGTVSINGGTLNVTGGFLVGPTAGLTGAVTLSSGTLNTDGLTIGSGTTPIGTFSQSGGTANINGNLTINASSSYTCTNSPAINITGNWANNNTFTAATSTVNFDGTAGQTISGTSTTTFSTLTIANAAGVTLSNSATVNTALNLTNGLVTTGTNTITVAAAGAINGGSSSSYINGKLARVFSAAGSKAFPVGKGGNYRPLTFQYVSLTGTSTVNVEQIESPLTTGVPALPANTDLYTARYWNISQTGATTFNYKVTLDATGYGATGTISILKKDASIVSLPATAAAPNYTMTTGLANSGNLGSPSAFAIASACSAATINTQPAASQAVCPGTSVSFTVAASSATSVPVTYQWKKNSVAISGATSSTYTISSPVAADAATYTVDVTSCGITVTSSNAVLAINQLPSITGQPAASQSICVGSPANFSVTATGTGLTYQWRIGTTNLVDGGTISGSTAATLNISAVATGDAVANYNCVVSGTCGSPVISNNAALIANQLPSITTQPVASQSVCSGVSVSFSVTATGTGLTYKWYKGATLINNGGSISGATTSTLTINPVATGDAALNYNCVVSGICSPAATSSNSELLVTQAASITTQPAVTQSICNGNGVSFSVTAAGAVSGYQWYRGATPLADGGTISGSATSTLTISAVVAGDAATNYNCVVSGTSPCGNITSNNSILIVNQLPAITVNPVATQTVCSGTSVSLSVAATGAGLTYQWYKGATALSNGGNISGATSATLTFNPIATTDAASNYYCIVSGTCSPNVTSANAEIIVNQLVAITSQPVASQSICLGNPASFSIAATGDGLTYQWYKGATPLTDGGTISGSNTSTLTISSIAVSDGATNYNCVVSGISPCGPVTSNNATLIVSQSAFITSQPIGTQTVCAATSVSISVGATGAGLIYNWYNGATQLNNLGNISGAHSATLTINPVTTADASANYYVVITGTCGNITSDNSELIVNPLPVASISYDGSPYCSNGGTATVTQTGQGGGTYSSTSGLVINSSTGDVNLAASTAGTYLVTYTFTDGTCPTTTSASITITALPVATISYTGSPYCSTSGIVTVTRTGDAGGVYSAAGGLSLNPVTGAVNVGTSTAGTYTVSYIIAAAGGCSVVTATTSITITTLPVATIAYTGSPYCFNSGTATVTQTGNTGGTYTSTAGLVINSSTGDINLGTSTPNTYTVTYTIAAVGGCAIVSTTASITIVPLPTVTTAATKATCSGTGPNISLAASAPSTFGWTIGTITGGITGASNGSGNTINQVLTNPSNTTAGTVQYIVTPTSNTGSCAGAPYTITVTVNPLPVVTNASTLSICNASATGIGLTASISSNFTWALGTITGGITGAAAGSGSTINQTLTNPSNSTAGTVQYIVTPTATSTGLCTGPAYTITVTVNPKPAVTNSATASTCSGTSPNIDLTASTPSNFTWTVSAGTGTVTGATGSSGSTINQTLTNTSNSTAATIKYNVTPTSITGSCPGAAYTITVTVNPTPVVTTSATKTTCSGTSPNIGLTASTPSNFAWTVGTITGGIIGASDGSGNTINQTLANPSNTTAGTVQYIVTPTSTTGSCAGAPYTITVTVNPVPLVTVTSNYCYGGGNVQLTANASTTSTYVWSTGATTQSILVKLAGTYTVTATNTFGCTGTSFTNVAQELTTNGNFSAGNTGFTSSYTYTNQVYTTGTTGLYNEGLYTVASNAHLYHPSFYGNDHTTGSGNFMIVNGNASGSFPTVWQETVNSLTPNTTYYFSAWAMSLNNVSPYAQLQFNINGTQVGTKDTLTAGASSTAGPFVWTQFYGSWNSGAATSAVISITDLQNAAGGNDFGLDDISFGTLSPVTFAATPAGNGATPASVCIGNTLTLTGNVAGGSSPFTYAWTGPNSFTSNVQNPPAITNVTAANAGTYNLSVTDGYGCPISSSVTVTVNPLPVDKTPVAQNSTVCSGTSTNIQIATSQSGVSYQLQNGGVNVGTAVAGTGGTINLPTGNLTVNTTFTVMATNSITTCNVQMVNTTTVSINPLPTAFAVSGGGAYCVGSAGVSIGLSGSQSGFNYALSNGTTTVNLTGTGSSLTFGPQQFATGTYIITATNNVTGCIQTMTGSVTVTANALPTITSVTGTPLAVCIGSSSNLVVTALAQSAITIFTDNFNATPTFTGAGSVTGSGSFIFGQQSSGYTVGFTSVSNNDGSKYMIAGAASFGNASSTTTLTSGIINTNGYTSLSLNFRHSYQKGNESGVTVQVSTDGGATWTTVTTYSSTQGSSSSLVSATAINLNAYINQSNLKIRFNAAISVSGGTAWWAIDDVVLSGAPNYLYSWVASPSGATAGLSAAAGTASTSNGNISVSPTVATTYTVKETNVNGCSITGNVSLTVNPVPAMTSATSASICSGAAVSISLTSDLTSTYSWKATDNTSTTGESTTAQPSSTLSNTITNTSTTNQNVIYTVTPTTTPAGCAGSPQTVTVTVYAPIVNKAVSPGTITICYGTSTNITINNTDVGVNYQLRNNATNSVIGTIAGDGNSKTISTGILTATTTFNVLAVNATTSCTAQMAVTPVVTVAALAVDKTPAAQASPICSGSSTNIQIASSQSGVSYQLRNNVTNANVGSAVAGTGGPINLPTGVLASTTTFNVLATTGTPCSVQMVNTVTVTVTSPITNNNITLASLCQTSSTSAQVVITQDATTLGGGNGTFTYSWEFSSPGNSSYAPVAGQTSSSLTISQTANNGFYHRIVTSGGCSSTSGSIHVNINNVLTASSFTITGGGSYCSGGSGVAVGLSGSVASQPEYYVTYQLFFNSVYTGNSVIGTGSAISFGNQTAVGTYTVQSIVTATGGSSCSAVSVTGSVSVSINPLPSVANQTSSICSGTAFTITPSGTPAGTVYTWNAPTGSGFTGGSAQATGQSSISQTLTNTTSSPVIATYNTVTPTSGMGCAGNNFTVTVTINPTPTINAVSQLAPVCAGSGATINLTGLLPGNTFTVSYSVNGTTQTPISGVVADASGTASFTTINLIAANNGQTLLITGIDNGTCSQTFSKNVTLAVNATGTWLGVNTNWFDNQNWCGGVPTISTDALIPGGLMYYPNLNSDTGMVKNLTINSGASVTVNGSGILQISGGISNSGNFDATAGTIELNGSAPQTIAGSMFTAHTVNNLTISNTSIGCVSIAPTINDTFKIAGALAFGNVDNAHLTTNDNLTLLSNASNTARVADATNAGANSGNTIAGKVNVERFIQSHRAWRLLTAPINTAQTINDSWQEGQTNTATNGAGQHYSSLNYGTEITNTIATNTTATGFDQAVTNNPSILYLNPTGTAWVVPANTNTTNVNSQQGFMLFVRGDRSVVVTPPTFNPSTPTVLRTKGNLNQGTQTITPAGTGFRVIGNPYASATSLNNIFNNNNSTVGSTYYVWDPLTTGGNGVGSFITVISDGVGMNSYHATSYISPYVLGTIESGAAFVFNFSNTDPLSIQESDKNITSALVFRPADNSSIQSFRADLYAVNPDNTSYLEDGTLTLFNNQYSNTVSWLEDAKKLSNISENFSLLRGGQSLSIEKRQPVMASDTIFLSIARMKQQTYQFVFAGERLSQAGLEARLEDTYLNSSTPISLTDTTKVNFNVNADALSQGATRFRIVFKPLAVVPVTFTYVKASQQNSDIAVQWNVTNQLNIQEYEVEKSTDGNNFSKAYTVAASSGNSSSGINYNLIDNNPSNGNNYYRIKAISTSGTTQYSNIVRVTMAETVKPAIAVYPNPIQNGIIGLKMSNMIKGTYHLRLLNSLGQEIFIKSVEFSTGNSIQHIPLNKGLAKGTYNLEIEGPGADKTTLKVIN